MYAICVKTEMAHLCRKLQNHQWQDSVYGMLAISMAMVVAETRQQALDAIELIDVRYSSLPAVCDVYDAMAEGAPQLYDCYERNIVFDWEAGDIDGAQAKIDEAVAQGAQLVEIDVVNSRILPNSMETRPMIAMPSEAGGLRIWCGSQGPVGLAEQIATALSMEQQDVHVLTGDVGGGFGFKIFLHPEQLCIAWAAKKEIWPDCSLATGTFRCLSV